MEAWIRVGEDSRNGACTYASEVHRIEQGVVPGDDGTNLALFDTAVGQGRGVAFRCANQFAPIPPPRSFTCPPMNDCYRIRRLVRILAPSVPHSSATRTGMAHS